MRFKVSPRFGTGPVLCLALAIVCLPSGLAMGDGNYRNHPGYVDGSDLAELAGDHGTLVEVSIHGALLKQVGRALSKRHDGLGSFLSDISAVSAVVVEHPQDEADTRKRIKQLAEQLDNDDWERIARVRDGDEDVWVFVKYDDDGEELNGLTVLVRGGSEFVFVNLAGRIDLELVGELGLAADIPGLDEILDEDITRELQKYERKQESKKKRSKHKPGDDGRSEEGGAR